MLTTIRYDGTSWANYTRWFLGGSNQNGMLAPYLGHNMTIDAGAAAKNAASPLFCPFHSPGPTVDYLNTVPTGKNRCFEETKIEKSHSGSFTGSDLFGRGELP